MKNEELIEKLQIQLGRCAGRYRASPPDSDQERAALDDYYETFNEMVRVNGSIIGLDPDSELPDNLMPEDYVNFWLQK